MSEPDGTYRDCNNFVSPDELTVTITLAEYWRLVSIATLWCAAGNGAENVRDDKNVVQSEMEE